MTMSGAQTLLRVPFELPLDSNVKLGRTGFMRKTCNRPWGILCNTEHAFGVKNKKVNLKQPLYSYSVFLPAMTECALLKLVMHCTFNV